MTTPEIIGQVLSIIGMAVIFASLQIKNRIGFYVVQIGGNLLFTISFLLLGNIAGALMNLLGIVRGFMMMQPDEKRRTWQFVLMNLLFVAAAIFAATVGKMGWDALFSVAAQVVGTVCMWYGGDRTIRWGQLCIISPLWLINNTLISFSIGGVLGEAFNMVSASIYLIRQFIGRLRVKKQDKNAKGA